MRNVTTPAPVDHTMPLFKYLQPISTSGSSREDSSMASEARSVVCLARVYFLCIYNSHIMPSTTLAMLYLLLRSKCEASYFQGPWTHELYA